VLNPISAHLGEERCTFATRSRPRRAALRRQTGLAKTSSELRRLISQAG